MVYHLQSSRRGPPLQPKDDIALELSLHVQVLERKRESPRADAHVDEFTVWRDVWLCVRVSCCVRQAPAQPLSTEDAEWEGVMASMLEAPQGNASYLPHTVPHTHSTLSIFVNGVLVARPCQWGGAPGKKPDLASGAKAGAAAGTRSGGCFAVRFRHEGDSVEVKVILRICVCVYRQGGREAGRQESCLSLVFDPLQAIGCSSSSLSPPHPPPLALKRSTAHCSLLRFSLEAGLACSRTFMACRAIRRLM